MVGTVENVAKEVRQFLADPASYTPTARAVDIHETHGALVFLAGEDAWKIKKPVTFPYMDFSTLEKRREICLREYLLNKPAASELYLGIVPITREPGGKLVFDGKGEVIEWALHMRRFAQSCLLDKILVRGEGTNALFDALARVISAYHTAAPQSAKLDHEHMMRSIVDELNDAFSLHKDSLSGLDPHAFELRARQQLAEAGYCLRMRAERGLVRRCHGDLHLTNILIQNGEPILFDGLEFSEELATTDILYDLSFVLMDLDQRGERGFANYLLNRYLHVANDPANLYGLKALPLFLACRAAILAMVALDRLDQLEPKEIDAIARTTGDARRYFKGAISYLQPTKPRLIAIGGFSGTGKSTIAASISGIVDGIIGGVHIRSDVERKAMFDVSETTRLAPERYTEDVTERVYDVLFQKARIALKADHTVVVDAVFSCGLRRVQIERVAQNLSLEFVGIWLTAPEDVLTARISGRQGDASDATPDVVRRQITQGTGPISWNLVDAGATREDVIKQACKMCR